MKPLTLCSYKLMIKDYKCKKYEEDLKKCFKNNEYNIKFCRNERKIYEYCLLKEKQYKKLLKD